VSASDLRLDSHGSFERGAAITIELDGQPVTAFLGESLAAAVLATGRRMFHASVRSGQPRGFYCGMGVCYECVMEVDGQPNQRACMTAVRPGLQARTQRAPFESVSPVPGWP
jgi:predicted molibdopterin-dependent oxidoreductase YjgC